MLCVKLYSEQPLKKKRRSSSSRKLWGYFIQDLWYGHSIYRRTAPANQPFYALKREKTFSLSPFRGSLASPASFLRCHASFQQGNIWTVLNGDHTCAHQQRQITTQPSIGSYLESNLGCRNNGRSFENIPKWNIFAKKYSINNEWSSSHMCPETEKQWKNICAENMKYETTMRAKNTSRINVTIYLRFTSRITLWTWQLRLCVYLNFNKTWLLIICGYHKYVGLGK